MESKGKKMFKTKFTLNKNMRDYGDDPALKRKHDEAIAFFEKNGYPDFVKNDAKNNCRNT